MIQESGILMSIKSHFVRKIKSGEKTFEFRKKIGLDFAVGDLVYVYESAPVSKITLSFRIKEITYGAPEEVWEKTAAGAGITKTYFDVYFDGKEKAYAIAIKDVRSERLSLGDVGLTRPPQSFCYIGRK